MRMSWTSPIMQPERAPLSLLAFAAGIGLILSLLAPITEQEGIDGALVLAGIVHYPPQSPMNQYFLGSWTVIHQIGALLLRAGLDQAYVNELFFVIPCALLVCAYAAIIYCFSGQFLLSLLAAPLCYLANPLAKYFASPDYMPVGLVWTQAPDQTFGFWAHVGAVWVIGCVAAGRRAVAGFSAVVLISVHPVLGAYIVALLTTTLLAGRLFLGLGIQDFAKGAALGAFVTIASFAAYLMTRPDLSGPIDQAAYDAYMNFWDTHRSHVMTPEIAARIAIAAAIAIGVLSVFIIFARPRREPVLQTSALVMLAVVVSTIAYFAMHLVPDLLPEIFTRAAPGRLLNVQAFLSTPMTLGLALFVANSAARNWQPGATGWVARALPITVLLLVIVNLAAYVLPRSHLIAGYAQKVLAAWTQGHQSPAASDDASFWSDVRETGVSGLALTSRSASRPVLVDGHLPIALNVGSFDFVPYIPRTAGAVAQIVDEGYGISFSDPPPDIWHGGALPPDGGRQYWAQLSPDGWCRMSRDLDVAAVVAPSDWTVNLPPFAKGTIFTMYKIACDRER
jgi:hypothetical protein